MKLWRLIRWLLPGGDAQDGPIGGHRGWLHFSGNGTAGWSYSHTQRWHDPAGTQHTLEPDQARRLGLWAERAQTASATPEITLEQGGGGVGEWRP